MERKFKVNDIVYVWGTNTRKIYKSKVIKVAPIGAKTMWPYTCDSLGVADINGNIIEPDSGDFDCRESAMFITAEDAYNSDSAEYDRQFHKSYDIYYNKITNIQDLLEFPIEHDITTYDKNINANADVAAAYMAYKIRANELFGIKIL